MFSGGKGRVYCEQISQILMHSLFEHPKTEKLLNLGMSFFWKHELN